VKPQESLATFPRSKTHQPLLQQAFQDMTRQNLPTQLGEVPKKIKIYESSVRYYP